MNVAVSQGAKAGERFAAYVDYLAAEGYVPRNAKGWVDLIRAKGDPTKLPAEERDIVTYARQLVEKNRIDQAAFDALQRRHDAQWLVELTAAANYYGFLSGVVNAFEVPAPPDGDRLPK
jgi:alkylhydroperoxidase family enzyme